ncbi:alpha-L-fucosidase [Kitasatospora sp. NPDC057015]|uniref:alpha-L-fucosidase n=1 Tax=Kitasatospora sp. NPDC057015 TaxID=3346001 RepID=UPI00363704FD
MLMAVSRRGFLSGAATVVAATSLAQVLDPRQARAATGPYQPTWASVNRHDPAPEWFQDAKFGIYFHWGVFSVPAFGSEWYPHNMYTAGTAAHAHHVETFGEPAAWPYHNFIDGGTDKAGRRHQFAPRPVSAGGAFDPGEWAALFKAAGARFAGPVAEHHDGYSMWDSRVNEWNSAARGPRLDLLLIFTDAIRGQGMKLLVAMHHAYNFAGYYGSVPAQSDPSLRKLYGQLGSAASNQLWYDKLKEVVDRSRPDIVYQDFKLNAVDERQRLNFLAYYYNQAASWGKEVVATYKDGFNDQGEVFDYERGGPTDLREPYWLTDDSISSSSWCYTTGIGYYTAAQLTHALFDRISKNGTVLLNIAPTADGVVPQGQRDVLLAIGDHLARFGEAVYDTRAWTDFGEGPTRMGGGSFFQPTLGTPQDIRFTRDKAATVLYATALGWPADGLTSTTLTSRRIDLATLASVELLGPDAGRRTALTGWTQDGDGLHVPLPATAPFAAAAYTLRLAFSGGIPRLRPTTRVTAFKDVDHRGALAELRLGGHTAARLRAAGLPAPSISSLQVPPGYRVVGYSGDDFTGTSWTFAGDTADLRTAGANDRITSLRVTLDPAAWFRIRNIKNALLVGGGDVPAGSALKVLDPGAGTDLQWHAVDLGTGYYRLVNRTNGLVVDGTGTTGGGRPEQQPWTGGKGQQWLITDAGGHGVCTVANRATGRLLDGGGAVASGSPLKVGPADTSTYRQWCFDLV